MIPPVLDREVTILTALSSEADAIARALGLPISDRSRTSTTQVGQCVVHLSVIGIRAHALPDELKGRIVLAGLGGALSPTLRIGDVVFDVASTWRPTPGPYVAFAGSDEVVGSIAGKANLFATTGALLVEMEGQRVRDAAKEAGLLFLGIRAVSDSAGDAINPQILRWVDSYGRVKPAALARGLLRRPLLTAQLIRLGRDSKLALRNLGDAIRQVLHTPDSLDTLPPARSIDPLK